MNAGFVYALLALSVNFLASSAFAAAKSVVATDALCAAKGRQPRGEGAHHGARPLVSITDLAVHAFTLSRRIFGKKFTSVP